VHQSLPKPGVFFFAFAAKGGVPAFCDGSDFKKVFSPNNGETS
jgi:hypothetical protein